MSNYKNLFGVRSFQQRVLLSVYREVSRTEFDRLGRSEQVAVRLRYGSDLVQWYHSEVLKELMKW